tara:strand:+ start:457 stop:1254 length:798 start_codon:yes stop_codon:yes gene_type:complete
MARKNILKQIKEYKLQEIKEEKKNVKLEDFNLMIKHQSKVKKFIQKLKKAEEKGFGLIAEIKKASPSKGIIRQDFNVKEIISSYEKGGAACLSILTDEKSFLGKKEYLTFARSATNLPILRKDFIFDVFQIFQSRALGADCILIILAAVDDVLARELESAAIDLKMDVLIEIHNLNELDRALKMKSKFIGINNRNLVNFVTDLKVTENIVKEIPEGYQVVSESGYHKHSDLLRIEKVNVKSFLIGESLMKEKNILNATKKILGKV